MSNALRLKLASAAAAAVAVCVAFFTIPSPNSQPDASQPANSTQPAAFFVGAGSGPGLSAPEWKTGDAASFTMGCAIHIESGGVSGAEKMSGVATALVLAPEGGRKRLAVVLTGAKVEGVAADEAREIRAMRPTPLILEFGAREELLVTLAPRGAEPGTVTRMAGLFQVQVVRPADPAARQWQARERDCNGVWDAEYRQAGAEIRKTRKPASAGMLAVSASEAVAVPGAFWVATYDAGEMWALEGATIRPHYSLRKLPGVDAEGLALLQKIDTAAFERVTLVAPAGKPELPAGETAPATIPEWTAAISKAEPGGAKEMGRWRVCLEEYLREHPEACAEVLGEILAAKVSPIVSSHLVTALEEAGAVQEIFTILKGADVPRDAFIQALHASKALVTDPERMLAVVDRVLASAEYESDPELWSAGVSAWAELARVNARGRKALETTLDAVLQSPVESAVAERLLVTAARGRVTTGRIAELARTVYSGGDLPLRKAAVPILAATDETFVQTALHDPQPEIGLKVLEEFFPESGADPAGAIARYKAAAGDRTISPRVKNRAVEMLAQLKSREGSNATATTQ